jgi:MFS family permease
VTLYRVALLTILLHLAYSGTRVTLSLFALSLGASAVAVGILMSLLAIVPMIFAVSWGRYIDRVGVRMPMYVGTGCRACGRCAGDSRCRDSKRFLP